MNDGSSTENTIMSPGIAPGDNPPFHKLGPIVFQKMCRDLLDKQTGIRSCEVFGVQGQAQFGIDLLAYRTTQSEIEVGQCKAYERCSKTDIKNASDDFFENWDSKWKHEGVKRFVLFVACDLSTTQHSEEIKSQKERFLEKGIVYEAWSSAKIKNELRPHRGIVAEYCVPSDHWLQVICGETAGSLVPRHDSSPLSSAVFSTLSNQLDVLAGLLTGETEQKLQLMRANFRQGKKKLVASWVHELKADVNRWNILSPNIKSKVIRFEAGLSLEIDDDVSKAKNLANQAKTICPSEDESRIRALIAHRENDNEGALKIISSPEDIDSANLKASLLLYSGKLDESIECLMNLPFEQNAETMRVRALGFLFKADVASAIIEIEKALELEPQWESILTTAAVVYYYSALSPIAIPSVALPWPEPVVWGLVRRDDLSLKYLRKGVEILRTVLSNVEVTGVTRSHLLSWLGACLINDSERQEVAIEFYRATLDSDPSNLGLISWAIARNLGMNLQSSISELEKRVEDNPDSIPEVIGLAGCYLYEKLPEKNVALLESKKELFLKKSFKEGWTFWYSQGLINSQKFSDALELLAEFTESLPLNEIKTLALKKQAQVTKNWSLVSEHLEGLYNKYHEPAYLLELCEIKANSNDWDYISNNDEKLISSIQTSDVVRLAAIANFNSKKYDRALLLLDSNLGLFSSGRLPNELRRLRVLCNQELGLLPNAVSEAEEIAREEPSLTNLLALASLYSKKGDFKNLAILARKLLGRDDLDAENALKLSSLVQYEDRELAIQLWNTINEEDVHDDLVGATLSLGFQLGMDSHLGAYFSRMHSLAAEKKGGIQALSLDEIVSHIKQRGEHFVKLQEFYENGQVPIHMLATQLSRPLSDFYHRQLIVNSASIQHPLMYRHGGRSILPIPAKPPGWRLNLDITSLLVAHHLDVLGAVENVFSPVRIAGDVIPALTAMVRDLNPSQPTNLAASVKIVDLVRGNKIRCFEEDGEAKPHSTLVAMLRDASASNGLVVEYLPLKDMNRGFEPPELSDELVKLLINCRSVVEALRVHGPFSSTEYERALSGLGNEGQATVCDVLPDKNTNLFLTGNIPHVLATAGVLDTVVNVFKVTIENSEYLRSVEAIAQNEVRKLDSEWIASLIGRINKGLDSGSYNLIEASKKNDLDEEDGTSVQDGFLIRSLQSIFSFPIENQDVICADDRFISSYSTRDQAPIVGIIEVLQVLVSAKHLSLGRYYELLSQLRRADVRYIPPSTDEILFHLKDATVRNGDLVETEALRILRKYIARCILSEKYIQKPPMPPGSPNPTGESAFVVSIIREVSQCIVKVWLDGTASLEKKTAQSNWIYHGLFLDQLNTMLASGFKVNRGEDRYIASLSFSSLILHAFGSLNESNRDYIEAYFKWLAEVVLNRKFLTDPLFLTSLVDQLKDTILHIQSGFPNSRAEKATGVLVLQRFFQILPEQIQNEMSKDPSFIAGFGLVTLNRVDVLGASFEAEDFWKAVSEAVNGRNSSIKDDSGRVYSIEGHQTPRKIPAVRITSASSVKPTLIEEKEMGILLDSPSQRQSHSMAYGKEMDLPPGDLKRKIDEIILIPSPLKRIESLRNTIARSVVGQYKKLNSRLKSGNYSLDDFELVDVKALVEFLRIENIDSIDFNSATKTLVSEIGLLESIRRFWHMPVSLSEHLISSISALDSDGRKGLVRSLLRSPQSPMTQIHFVRILENMGKEEAKYLRLSRRLQKSLFSLNAEISFKTFMHLLKWVNDELPRWKGAEELDSQFMQLLSWGHASQILSLFVAARASIDGLEKQFAQLNSPHLINVFNREQKSWNSILHPRHHEWPSFVLSGLSYSLSGRSADETIQKMISDNFLSEDAPPRIPRFFLLRDLSLTSGYQNSIFGGDRENLLKNLLNVEDKGYGSAYLSTIVAGAIKELSSIEIDDPNTSWGKIHALMGDLSPYDSLREEVKNLILKTDLIHLYKRDNRTGNLALLVCAMQTVGLRDSEVVNSLKTKLPALCNFLREQSSLKKIEDSQIKEIYTILIEAAAQTSSASGDSMQAAGEFGDLLQSMIDSWPELLVEVRHLIERFFLDLPISQSAQFGRLLLRTRLLD